MQLDLNWGAPLRHRVGADERLCGIDVFHDFEWREVFPDERTQFKNGKSLAKFVQDRCQPKEWIAFGVKRSQDKNLAAKLLLLEHTGEIAGTGKASLDRFVEFQAEKTRIVRGDGDPATEPEESGDDLVADIDEAGRQSKSDFSSGAASVFLDESLARVLKVLDRMCDGFAPKSSALSLSANIVVYYWLFRENPEYQNSDLAGFLDTFATELREFLEIVSNTPIGQAVEVRDPQLALYYTYQRTSNDKRSIAGRFEILQGRLDAR